MGRIQLLRPLTGDEISDRPRRLLKPTEVVALIGAAVSLAYLVGYLSLRQELTVFGVPASLDTFDERYLFRGAAFIRSFLFSITNTIVSALALCAVIASVGAVYLRRKRLALIIPDPVRIAATCAAPLLSLLAIYYCQDWLTPDVFVSGSVPPALRFLAGDGARMDAFKVFLRFIVALFGVAALVAIGWRAWRVPHWIRWTGVAVLLLQALTVPMLWAVLESWEPKPRVRLDGGPSGVLLWEDKETLTLLSDLNGMLTRYSKKDIKVVQIEGTANPYKVLAEHKH